MEKYTITELEGGSLKNALEYTAELCGEEESTWENRDWLLDYAERMGFWFDENGDRV